jgi:dienelactone hydrolase
MKYVLIRLAVAIVTTFAIPAVALAVEKNVSIPLNKSDYAAQYVPELASVTFTPAGPGPFPTIIYLHGCGPSIWVSEPDRKTVSDYATHFAAEGYATLVLDSYDSRQTNGRACTDFRFSEQLRAAGVADIDAAVHWLVDQKIAVPNKIVAFGASLGGQQVLTHAQRSGGGRVKLAGAIALYGGCGAPHSFFANYPLLLLTGALDDTNGGQLMADACRIYMRKVNATKGGAKAQLIVYPDAAHNFDHEGAPPDKFKLADGKLHIGGYNAVAAAAAYKDIDKFLSERFAAGN